jgi:hypothetical protein
MATIRSIEALVDHLIQEMQLREIGLDEQFIRGFRQTLINDFRAREAERFQGTSKRIH